MGLKKILGVPVWPHWVVTALSFLLFLEYARIVLMTDAPAYRVVVMIVLGVALAVSLVRLLRMGRDPARKGRG
ncbi:MAG: hypothetical protein LJE95_09040 [Acidobacteria bacterium]|nr:hypothetical protein [Acidobacteriota bacterium]